MRFLAVGANARFGAAMTGLALIVVALAVLVPMSVSALRSPHQPSEHGHHESPAVQHPEVSGLRVVTREKLASPVPAFNFRLTAHTGSQVSLRDFTGKPVLLSFVYTNCPEACPLLTEQYLQLQQRFINQMARGELALVLITTDPENDTPESLRDYTAGRGGNWLFLTGDLATLRPVWDGFKVHREVRRGLQDVVVYHSYKTFLLDGQGLVQYQYEGVWQTSQVASDIGDLLAQS